MEYFFVETLGIPEAIFSFVVLPLLIFFARILDVSINTVRIIYVLGGEKVYVNAFGIL